MVEQSALSFATSSLHDTRKMPAFSFDRNSMENAVKHLYNSSCARVDMLPDVGLIVLFVAAMNSMRISEVLGIKWKHYLGHGRFMVQAAKGGRGYVAQLSGFDSVEVVGMAVDGDRPVFPVSYFSVWKWCRRANIGFTRAGARNIRRTHAHRYVTAAAVCSASGLGAVGDVLHHRSGGSALFYT